MLSLRIALRYLLARKSHTAVNVISMISMAGIAVAALAMVCVLSVFNGFSDLAFERISIVDPDLRITPADGHVIANADSLASALSGIKGIRMAAAVLEQKALAISGETQLPVTVKGIPEGYKTMNALHTLVIDGEMVDPSDTTYAAEGYTLPMALLSVGAAINTGARPSLDRTLQLTVPRRTGRINPALPLAAFVSDSLYVSGVYQTNDARHDEDYILIPLSVARRLFEYTTQASAIELALDAGVSESNMASTIRTRLGDGYIVADRLEQQETSFRMIKIEKWITFAMLLFVLVMASFNILSTMSMLIVEKEDDMHILSALGASDSLVKRIFLNEGMLIAVIGGTIGIILGVTMAALQQHFGLISLGGDHSQMSVVAYPCRLALGDVLITAAVVAAIGIISGTISSRYAGR
ncbi:MAG: ABC transporter permease [Muribaculaceae bacterium]|nr:ABC transporter permease [Muribaculaceae bacterium]